MLPDHPNLDKDYFRDSELSYLTDAIDSCVFAEMENRKLKWVRSQKAEIELVQADIKALRIGLFTTRNLSRIERYVKKLEDKIRANTEKKIHAQVRRRKSPAEYLRKLTINEVERGRKYRDLAIREQIENDEFIRGKEMPKNIVKKTLLTLTGGPKRYPREYGAMIAGSSTAISVGALAYLRYRRDLNKEFLAEEFMRLRKKNKKHNAKLAAKGDGITRDQLFAAHPTHTLGGGIGIANIEPASGISPTSLARTGEQNDDIYIADSRYSLSTNNPGHGTENYANNLTEDPGQPGVDVGSAMHRNRINNTDISYNTESSNKTDKIYEMFPGLFENEEGEDSENNDSATGSTSSGGTTSSSGSTSGETGDAATGSTSSSTSGSTSSTSGSTTNGSASGSTSGSTSSTSGSTASGSTTSGSNNNNNSGSTSGSTSSTSGSATSGNTGSNATSGSTSGNVSGGGSGNANSGSNGTNAVVAGTTTTPIVNPLKADGLLAVPQTIVPTQAQVAQTQNQKDALAAITTQAATQAATTAALAAHTQPGVAGQITGQNLAGTNPAAQNPAGQTAVAGAAQTAAGQLAAGQTAQPAGAAAAANPNQAAPGAANLAAAQPNATGTNPNANPNVANPVAANQNTANPNTAAQATTGQQGLNTVAANTVTTATPNAVPTGKEGIPGNNNISPLPVTGKENVPVTQAVVTDKVVPITAKPDVAANPVVTENKPAVTPVTTEVKPTTPTTAVNDKPGNLANNVVDTIKNNQTPATGTGAESKPVTPVDNKPVVHVPESKPVTPIDSKPATQAPESKPVTPIDSKPVVQVPESKPVTPIDSKPATQAPESKPATPVDSKPVVQVPESKPVTPIDNKPAAQTPESKPANPAESKPVAQVPETKPVEGRPSSTIEGKPAAPTEGKPVASQTPEGRPATDNVIKGEFPQKGTNPPSEMTPQGGSEKKPNVAEAGGTPPATQATNPINPEGGKPAAQPEQRPAAVANVTPPAGAETGKPAATPGATDKVVPKGQTTTEPVKQVAMQEGTTPLADPSKAAADPAHQGTDGKHVPEGLKDMKGECLRKVASTGNNLKNNGVEVVPGKMPVIRPSVMEPGHKVDGPQASV